MCTKYHIPVYYPSKLFGLATDSVYDGPSSTFGGTWSNKPGCPGRQSQQHLIYFDVNKTLSKNSSNYTNRSDVKIKQQNAMRTTRVRRRLTLTTHYGRKQSKSLDSSDRAGPPAYRDVPSNTRHGRTQPAQHLPINNLP